MEPQVRLGVGIYSRADAARLLGVTPSRLHRWVSGYTYRYAHAPVDGVRKQPPVVRPDLPTIHDTVALSFSELMELRVVQALTERGISLQHVRVASRIASDAFHTSHPFASRRLFTHGKRIFSSVSADGASTGVIELGRDRNLQVALGLVLEPLLAEIDFDAATSLASKWWPLGRDTRVVLNPRIAFGAPTIDGTRIRTEALASMSAGSPIEAVAAAFDIDERDVRAAVRFENELVAA